MIPTRANSFRAGGFLDSVIIGRSSASSSALTSRPRASRRTFTSSIAFATLALG